MSFEPAAYGVTAAVLYAALPKKKPCIFLSLIGTMLTGRIVWGAAGVVLYGSRRAVFGWAAFLSGAFLNAIPGIIVQRILIPSPAMALGKYTGK